MIFCFSLLLTCIHFALVPVTLYWLCVLIHIFTSFYISRLLKSCFNRQIVALSCCVVSAIHQDESALSIHIPPGWWDFLPPPHLTPLGCHTAPGWAPCIIEQFPASYLLYAWHPIFVSATLSIHRTYSFPCCVHMSILCICVTILAFQIGS